MASMTIRLGPGECSDIETGARYFAALAFPGSAEESSRQAATKALVATYFHEINRTDGCDTPFENEAFNAYASADPEWCKVQLKTMRRRLRDRADFARAIRPWVWELLGNVHEPVPGIERFTQRQIAMHLVGDDPNKVNKFVVRVMRPSRPVTHIAAAQEYLFHHLGQEPGRIMEDLAGSAGIIGVIVQLADLFLERIISDQRFRVSHESLIHFEWIQ